MEQEEDRRVEDFAKELGKEDYSPTSIKTYSAILSKFYRKYDTISVPNIKKFIADGISEKKSYSNSYKFLILSFFKGYLRRRGRGKEADSMRFPRKEKYSPVALSKSQVKELLSSHVQKSPALQIRNQLILELLYSTGLRVSEVSSLNKSDVDIVEGFLYVRSGKGKKNRFVKLSKKWIKSYQKFVGGDNSKTPVFLNNSGDRLGIRSIQNIVRLASSQSGVMLATDRFVSPHKLRSTYATHAYESGEDVLAIQELLGHDSLDTTRKYTKISKLRLRKFKSPFDNL